jgi:hypothetical protein
VEWFLLKKKEKREQTGLALLYQAALSAAV